MEIDFTKAPWAQPCLEGIDVDATMNLSPKPTSPAEAVDEADSSWLKRVLIALLIVGGGLLVAKILSRLFDNDDKRY